MAWFFNDQDEPPKEVQDAIHKSFLEPNAKTPATKGEINGVIILTTSWLRTHEKRFDDSFTSYEKRLSAIDAKAEKKVAYVERKMQAFDPLEFTDGELGTKTVIMHLTDGRTAIVTKEVQSADGEAPAARKARIDLMEKTIRDLTSQLGKMQQQNSAMHSRLSALEKKRVAA
jgi:hypothetical protein